MAIRVTIQASDALLAASAAASRIMNVAQPLAAFAPSGDAVRAACRIVGVKNADISVTWLRDAEIAALNSEYLAHSGATDVISFPLFEYDEEPVGDIYIGYEQAARQASQYHTTTGDELIRLAVHGMLHVLGFDHPDGDDRLQSDMWSLQEAIVDELMNGQHT